MARARARWAVARVTVSVAVPRNKDRVIVDLYEGRQATRFLAMKR